MLTSRFMKKTQKNCFYLRTCGAALAAAAANVFALEPSDVLVFSHGPLSLRPQLGVSEQFNDNIFYSDIARRSDFITMISPGLKLLVGQDLPDQNHIKLQYTLDEIALHGHALAERDTAPVPQ